MKRNKMVFAGKIYEETHAFWRIARKCEGLKLKEIMEELYILRSSENHIF